ncbi:MAG TPA: tetratricopeptide repeat protein, partial [Candidatus Hydrogenedentes bacterium]|nr:tetratricopeptide repeat protein [Candidatus Hydrogenedentota bacterium]
NAHFNLATLLESAGDHAGAAEHFRKALEADPNFPGARERLERATRAAG